MLELYGTSTCPYTAELREELDWQAREYVEYDVDLDATALARLRTFGGGSLSVPVLVENGSVRQIGYQGRSCYLSRD